MLNETDILNILNEWNYWNKDFEEIFDREEYIKKIERARIAKEIVILTGVRRSGKSTLLKAEMKKLSKEFEKRQFLYVNFEDSRFLDELNEKLLENILKIYIENINPDKEIFLFFDEIQEIKNWEKFINTYYELKKATIFISGSTAKIINRDLSTVIAGRYIEISVFPLSFSEFCIFKNLVIKTKMDLINNAGKIRNLFKEFINYGGFPKIALINEIESKKSLLRDYFETILLKDIVERNSIKNIDNLRKTANFLLTNDSKLTNLNEIKKSINISYEATSDYISFFKESFFINEINSFDYSIKRLLKKNSKFYCIDTGIINISSTRFDENKGFALENSVLNHLLRNFKEVYYFQEKKECDFVVKDGTKIIKAIQVCYELHDKNKEREINGLIDAMDKFKLKEGLIITYNQEDELKIKNLKIKVIPAWKFFISL